MNNEEEIESSLCIMLIPDESFRRVRPGVVDIHLTLGYFGKYSTGDREPSVVRGSLAQIAKRIGGPIPAVANATGIFPDRDKFAIVDMVDGIGTFYARKEVEAIYGRASGAYDKLDIQVDYTHGFTPHVTRAYVTADQIMKSPIITIPSQPVPFTFDAIGVWHGHNHYELAL